MNFLYELYQIRSVLMLGQYIYAPACSTLCG